MGDCVDEAAHGVTVRSLDDDTVIGIKTNPIVQAKRWVLGDMHGGGRNGPKPAPPNA